MKTKRTKNTVMENFKIMNIAWHTCMATEPVVPVFGVERTRAIVNWNTRKIAFSRYTTTEDACFTSKGEVKFSGEIIHAVRTWTEKVSTFFPENFSKEVDRLLSEGYIVIEGPEPKQIIAAEKVKEFETGPAWSAKHMTHIM